MKNIGILIDNYHLKYKVDDFLKYLKSKADVKIYTEESYLFNSSEIDFSENIFFAKAKGDLILGFINFIEEETNIPVINSYKGTYLAVNRYLNSVVLKKAGLPVPEFSLNPQKNSPPFDDYIIKNIIDQDNYAFDPIFKEEPGHIKVADKRALEEVGGKKNYGYLYYQKFIDSEWEYKLYGIGEEVMSYRQIPVLLNPNKMESRVKITEIAELNEYCYKVMELMDLKITSMDFLQSKDNQFYLTDVNCTPNFNYIKNGHKIVADFLIEQAKI
ncbi:MAG: RimK family alpha-L-glutamate ligase [Candidatus Hodarchaeota archaeon]